MSVSQKTVALVASTSTLGTPVSMGAGINSATLLIASNWVDRVDSKKLTETCEENLFKSSIILSDALAKTDSGVSSSTISSPIPGSSISSSSNSSSSTPGNVVKLKLSLFARLPDKSLLKTRKWYVVTDFRLGKVTE